MRILVLNYEYPPLGGGAGVSTRNISECFAENGNMVTVISTWYKNEKVIEEKGNLTVIRLKARRKKAYRSNIFEMLSWIKKSKQFLKNHFKDHYFDICLANFAIPGGMVASYLRKNFGLNYAIISHGHDIPWMFPRQMFFYHLANYFRIKRICAHAKAVFVLNSSMKKNIDKFLGGKYAKTNIIIPNGINTDLFKPDYSKRDKKLRIIFIGRLVKQKDPLTFLQFVKIFSSRNIEFTVNIIGDGILRKKMETFVKRHDLGSYVNFSGWLNTEQIIIEYQAAHIIVTSSLFEGMPLSILESMACGCYVITTPLPGITSLIQEKENGSIVNFESPEEIVQKVEEYYHEKYLAGHHIDQKFIDQMMTSFSWRNLTNLYQHELIKIIHS